MTCPDRDLLLYAHNALPPLPRWIVSRHLARCARCQSRLADFTAVSSAIASAVRDPGMPKWDVKNHPSPTSWNGPALWIAVVLTAVIAGFIVSSIHSRQANVAAPPVRSLPCRPDLPNDRCR
jgi:anti-sigma factor RsiW